MFKKHSLNVQVVKTPKQTNAPEEDSNCKKLTPEQFSHVVKEQAKYAALLIGAGYTLVVILDTARQIALHTAKTKIS